jgi:hypothetical protein
MSEKKPTAASHLRAALPAVAGYGLGYGIARTALERIDPKVLSPNARKYAPLALGALAAYAGMKTDQAVARRAQEDA